MRYLACCAALGAFVLVFGPAWVQGFPAAFPDSSSYLDAAAAGLVSTELWFGERPPTYPLLVWAVGPSTRAVVVAQTLLAVGAWAWLAATVRHEIRNRWIAAATIVLLVLVAIQSRWAIWHGAILTESLSGSAAVAGIAAWWRWFSRPDRFRILAAVVITAAWMLLRDANAMTFLVVAGPAMGVAVLLDRHRPGPRRRGMATALAALVAVGAFSAAGQFASGRGEATFHNNVGMRWLLDEDMRTWMVDRGMPMSDALWARAGGDAWADGDAFLRSPELAEYRDWAASRGRRAAIESYVLRADWYLGRLWRDLPALADADHLAYDTHGLADRLPRRTLGFADPVGSRAAVVGWTVAVLVAAVVVARRRPRLAWLIPFWFLPVLADLYLAYVADAVEIGRHLVGPLLRFSVVAIVAVAVAADTIAARHGHDDVTDSGGARPDIAGPDSTGPDSTGPDGTAPIGTGRADVAR